MKFGAGIYTAIISFMSDFFVIGFRIALPVFSAILMLNCVLAILAKGITSDEYVCCWYAA